MGSPRLGPWKRDAGRKRVHAGRKRAPADPGKPKGKPRGRGTWYTPVQICTGPWTDKERRQLAWLLHRGKTVRQAAAWLHRPVEEAREEARLLVRGMGVAVLAAVIKGSAAWAAVTKEGAAGAAGEREVAAR